MMTTHARGPASLTHWRTTFSARRAVDLIVASTGLILAGPIMMLVALVLRMESGRPIFFSQVRLGVAGRYFRMYKFRKFHEQSGTTGPGVTVRNDSRLTRIGSFLGRTKLDELPQLWNILRGDMSIVGPRPESLAFADCITRGYRKVLEYKPGIFGPNQFYFRDEGSLYPEGSDPERFYREVLFPLKANIDLAYFPRRSVRGDIGWVMRGVLAVFGLRASSTKFDAMLRGWLDQR